MRWEGDKVVWQERERERERDRRLSTLGHGNEEEGERRGGHLVRHMEDKGPSEGRGGGNRKRDSPLTRAWHVEARLACNEMSERLEEVCAGDHMLRCSSQGCALSLD